MVKGFEVVLSLGGLCQVAYQIEQRFGFKFTSPFDWLVTPFDSIQKIFLDDGESFGRCIRVINDGSTAICHHYGLAYQHDYPRPDGHSICIDTNSMDLSRSKLLGKYHKFLGTLSTRPRTLFIRFGGHHDSAYPSPYRPDPRHLTTRDLNGLCAAIETKFPLLEFELAFVFMASFTHLDIEFNALDARIRLFQLHGDPGSDWRGMVESWAPIFESCEFDLVRNGDISQQFVGDRVNDEFLHI